MAVQRKLEILADANLSRGVPQKALPFIVLAIPRRTCSRARVDARRQSIRRTEEGAR